MTRTPLDENRMEPMAGPVLFLVLSRRVQRPQRAAAAAEDSRSGAPQKGPSRGRRPILSNRALARLMMAMERIRQAWALPGGDFLARRRDRAPAGRALGPPRSSGWPRARPSIRRFGGAGPPIPGWWRWPSCRSATRPCCGPIRPRTRPSAAIWPIRRRPSAVVHRTSGTSGQAMTLALSHDDAEMTAAVAGRAQAAAGLGPGHRVVHCLKLSALDGRLQRSRRAGGDRGHRRALRRRELRGA